MTIKYQRYYRNDVFIIDLDYGLRASANIEANGFDESQVFSNPKLIR